MLPRLRSGHPLDDNAFNLLRQVANDLENLRTIPNDDLMAMYLSWVSTSMERLQVLLPEKELSRLVLTEGYRTALPLMTSPSTMAMRVMRGVVHTEVDARHAQWSGLIADVTTWRTRWAEYSQVVVADTNLYVHHAKKFDQIQWHDVLQICPHVPVRVVVPMIVLDELDSLKRATHLSGLAKDNLRHTMREFAIRFQHPDTRSRLSTTELDTAITIELFLDDPDHVRLSRADNEIVDRARCLADLIGHQVHIVTGDLGMATRARAANLRTTIVTFPEEERRLKNAKARPSS